MDALSGWVAQAILLIILLLIIGIFMMWFVALLFAAVLKVLKVLVTSLFHPRYLPEHGGDVVNDSIPDPSPKGFLDG